MTDLHETIKTGPESLLSSCQSKNKKCFEINKHRRIFKCEFENCGRLFREKGNLRTHMRIHTGERPYVCHFENCKRSFITLGNLKSHTSNHTGAKPFTCSQYDCKKEYSRLCRLRIHERTHTGKKPYICPHPECNKTFNEKGNLKTHFRIHTGEKPFRCHFEGCGQSFKAHGHLKDHVKRHYNIKPYQCEICQAKFARNSTLKIHLNTHELEKASPELKMSNLVIALKMKDAVVERNSENFNGLSQKIPQEKKNIPCVQLKDSKFELAKNGLPNNELNFSNYYEHAKKIMKIDPATEDKGKQKVQEHSEIAGKNVENKACYDPSSILLKYLNSLLNIAPDGNNVVVLLDLCQRLNMPVEWLLAFAEMNISLTITQKVNLYLYNNFCNAFALRAANSNNSFKGVQNLSTNNIGNLNNFNIYGSGSHEQVISNIIHKPYLNSQGLNRSDYNNALKDNLNPFQYR